MPSVTVSPNMNLPVPVVGVDPGPQWATDVNSCLTLIDSHDHAVGSGVQITPSGMNINSDLPFNGSNLTTARSLRLDPQLATLSDPTDLGCLYEVADDLYYNDGNGTAIRITQSGAVAGTPGSISNLVSPASANYVAVSSTFVWQSDTNKPANMDGASFIFRNLLTNSKGLTLSPPAAMGSNFTIVLPSLPGSGTKFVSLDSSGNMGAAWAVDNSTIEVNANVVQVKALGITSTQLNDSAVTTNKIADSAVTTLKIADANVTTVKILNANVTRPKLVAVGEQVSNSSGSFTTTSTSYVDVTNLSVTLTTTGRPVILNIQPDGLATAATSVTAGSTMTHKYVRASTDISIWRTTSGELPMGALFIDANLGAGTYTYKVQVLVSGGTGAVTNMRLVAYEL